MKKKLLIAGGTGLIGSAIQTVAQKAGWEVTLLSRSPGQGCIVWNPIQTTINIESPLVFDGVINLAGTSIAGHRWTQERKQDIRDSRVHAGATLEKYFSSGLLTTPVYIGVSGVGIYGDRGDTRLTESFPIEPSLDWMIRTVQDWEASHQRIAALGIRTAILRLGLVLSPQGGALAEILKTTPFGFVTWFGKGNQIWPWVHIDDVVRVFMEILVREEMQGLYQVNAPNTVSNKTMAEEVAGKFSPQRLVMGVPAMMLRLMLGEMHTILLQSCNSYPERLEQAGFMFQYKHIGSALRDLVQP